jgi:hypothetical protein
MNRQPSDQTAHILADKLATLGSAERPVSMPAGLLHTEAAMGDRRSGSVVKPRNVDIVLHISVAGRAFERSVALAADVPAPSRRNDCSNAER